MLRTTHVAVQQGAVEDRLDEVPRLVAHTMDTTELFTKVNALEADDKDMEDEEHLQARKRRLTP